MTESARARVHAMFNLDETAEQELDARLDALVVEALVKAGVQYVDCPVCGAAQPVGGECGTCAFKARVAAELAARGKTTAPAATATVDFFQPGHTYTHSRWQFRCDHITTHPTTGEHRALGWLLTFRGQWEEKALDPDDWACGDWTDTTDTTQGDSK